MPVTPTLKAVGKITHKFWLHVLVWVLYFLYENGIVLILNPAEISIVSTLILFILNACIFYTHTYWILARTLPQKNYLQLVLRTLLLGILYMVVNYLITKGLEALHIRIIYSADNIKAFMVWRVFRFIYFICISYAYYLAVNTIRTERRLRILNEEKAAANNAKVRLEKEILSTELNYLRYQIHPHFLFNTLSFIYTQVVHTSKEAAKSVMLLSDIMRHALQHNEADKVKLEQEVQHLQNLLDIHQLRFNHTLCIRLELNDKEQFRYRLIAPLVLITFVENALKYGDLQDPSHPLLIKINLRENRFHFFIHNKKKHNQQQVTSAGIGLSNNRKRLDLLYTPMGYTLDIQDSAHFYTVSLKINL